MSGVSGTYLAKLQLTDDAGKEIGRNVYWLSTKQDVLDWDNTDWYYTPTTSYADLTGLDDMAEAPVSATATTTGGPDSTATTTVTLRNTASRGAPALLVDAHLVNGSDTPVLPVRWSDNQVSLWPGESVTLTATYRTADLGGSAPSVRISGWNTATRTIPAATKSR